MGVSFIQDASGGPYLERAVGEWRQAFCQLTAQQTLLSREQLCDLQAERLGPLGLFARYSRQVARYGSQATVFDDLPELTGWEHMDRAEQAVEFVLGHHQRGRTRQNPFDGLPREVLCCVVFDDAAAFTLTERFAASEALRHSDGQYFSKLIATTRHTVERRIVFMGLLEHYDALLPIEQCIYPVDYRHAQQQHLDREEALYGKLELEKSVAQLLGKYSPRRLLENLCASPS
jgi:hypothetical protein